MLDVSLFMPCYNEEAVLEKNALIVLKTLKSFLKNFEFVIVDDASTDKTLSIARKLARKHKEIKVMHYTDGPSRRENLLKSFLRARGRIIAFIDADLSTDPKHLKRLITLARKYDIVIGSRYVKGAKCVRSISRRLISFFWNLFMRIYFGSPIKDHFQGFKAFKRDVLFSLLKETGIGNKERRMFWDAEFLVRAQRRKCSIKEFPISWKEGSKSALRFFKEFSMIPYALKLKFKL